MSASNSRSNLMIPSGYDANSKSALTSRSRHAANMKMTKSNRRANAALIVIILCLSLASLLHAGLVVSRQMKALDDTEHVQDVIYNHEPRDKAVAPKKLPLEAQVFSRTVKSCLPNLNSKCQTYVHENNIPRVAILAPPGDFGDWIFRWASKVVDTRLGSTVKMDMQLVSSVPPYGYGKTHGWTKIIRILPRSLMLGAADAIRGSLKLGQTQNELTLRDLKAALRQLLRYHCRISHLAAHTAVLTLEMDILASTPYVATEVVLNFLNITAVQHGEREEDDIDVLEDSDDLGKYYTTREQDVVAMSNHVQAFASSLLTWIERHEQVNVQEQLQDVLKEELLLSKNFTKWPCGSMWTTGDGPQGTDLSPFARKLAQSLAPNCNGKYTSCPVKGDRCEEAGDVLCK
jgi:hypothetical protein